MKFNLPNALTWFRVVAIPLVVLVFYGPELFGWQESWARPATGLLFGLAGITDYFDGYLARRLGLTSSFGAFLDPVADKLFVVGALVILLFLGRVDPLVALIIIGREIAISALREWMAQVGQAKSVAVAFIGKLKTVVQMVAIPLLLYSDWLFGVVDCQWLGTILINVAAVLTVASMLYYLRKALPYALNSR
jgi:cardiolipin synthase (CMP-forming)